MSDKKPEHVIQNEIRLALAKAGVPAFRNNVGAYKTQDGRFVTFGVGEKGGSDLICITPVKITEDMIGATVGVFTAIEVKTPKGRVSKEQEAFISAVLNYGGFAGVARSDVDALRIVRKTK